MTSSTFHPDGKAQLSLARLTEGPATLSELRDALGPASNSLRRKHIYVVSALVDAGFVVRIQGQYEITPKGEEALDRLRAGESVSTDQPRPNVRVFARAA